VGRIAAVLNRRHLETYDDGVGFFGFFECIDDPDVAHALLRRAARWLARRGMRYMRGPTSFTINDECGVLLDAFDQPPMVMMPYTPPYYPALLEGFGLAKAHDLIAFRCETPEQVPKRLQRAEAVLTSRYGITLRTISMARLDDEIRRIHHVYSRAWAGNWGAVPLTASEVRHMAADLRRIADPELVLLAERGDEPVGVSLTIPNVNQALARLNGRLLPLGIVKLLWHLRRIDEARVLIMGVVPGYRRQAVDAAMYGRTMAAARRRGIRWAELSWILEDNIAMIRALERIGAVPYKTYRIYEMPLDE
jgi:GNAT superfamily N-acetyltransferase